MKKTKSNNWVVILCLIIALAFVSDIILFIIRLFLLFGIIIIGMKIYEYYKKDSFGRKQMRDHYLNKIKSWRNKI